MKATEKLAVSGDRDFVFVAKLHMIILQNGAHFDAYFIHSTYLLEAEMKLDLRIVNWNFCHLENSTDLLVVEIRDANRARQFLL